MGDYGVSIIHINSSTIVISIVEPQNDADTFINNCGETGERPAIRVMITINDVWVTYKHTEDINKNVQLDISYTYDNDNDSLGIYDILFAIIKPKLDGVKASVAADVFDKLSQFASYNGIATRSFNDVVNTAKGWANAKGMNIVDFLNEYK